LFSSIFVLGGVFVFFLFFVFLFFLNEKMKGVSDGTKGKKT